RAGSWADEQSFQIELPSHVQWRAVLMLILGGMALYFLLMRFAELRQAVDALRYAHWVWLIPAVLCASFAEVAAVVSLIGALDRPLAFQTMMLVQLASTFLGRITPKGIGGIGLIEYYLERTGVERPVAVTAIATAVMASSVVHIPALVVASALMGTTNVVRVHLPKAWLVFAAVVVIIIALDVVLFLYSDGARRKLTPLFAAGRTALGLLRDPVRAAKLFGGAAGVIAMKTLTLAMCLRACGASVPLLVVMTIYLGGTALSSASPTPGGLGPLELALVAGLSAVGVQLGIALAGVLIFRLFTFWLPMIPAMAALCYLQSRQII
ncbi:MAG: lysylphosphatidylglycerol synthase transmembrane domain-containing protein, partial [Anaerolineae bacterium]